jgi:acyl-CoA thioesterase FadM
MNLYLRLMWTLLRGWWSPPLRVGDTLERQFRVLPNDLDVNAHMNNGRYMTIVDLMLTEYFVRIGIFRVLVVKKWRPMLGGSFITYRRGLQPFQSYRLRYRIEACDQHWNYMHFEFLSGEKLCASGYMKGAVVAKSGLILNSESYAAIGIPLLTQPLPEAVSHWLAAENALVKTTWE